MKLLGTASILAFVSAVAPVMALDIGGGFSLTGNLQYEHMSTNSTEESFGWLNADLTYENASGFGGFVGVQAISFGSSEEAIYGALSYSGDFGKIQIGVPRNALDDYIDTPVLGGLEFFDLQLSPFTGSFLPVQMLGSNNSVVGLRYDGTFGAASVGLSYHDIEGARLFDAAMNYRFGDTVIKAGTEQISDSGLSASSYYLGAEQDFGQVTAGVLLGTSDFIGTGVRTAKLYATYSPNDRLDLTAIALTIDSSGPSGTLYGINANYDLSNDVFVEAGYMGSSGGGVSGSDMIGVSIGINF